MAALSAIQIDALIANIDRSLARQLDEVLHHPEFQKLEAAWSGIRHLIECVPAEFESGDRLLDSDETSNDGIIVSLWNVSKDELMDDLRYASNYRRSAVYRKVYRESYNVFGGKPFSVIVGDYDFTPSADDCFLLREISKVVSESFTVFVGAANAEVFGLDSFQGLDLLGNAGHDRNSRLAQVVEELPEWNELREAEESRFIALTLPRMLARRPYDYRRGLGELASSAGWRDLDENCVLRYRENIKADGSSYLWVNAAYAFAGVTAACYGQSGWLADIHGIPEEGTGGGIVARNAYDVDNFLDSSRVAIFKPLTEILISDQLEKELTDLGILTLCHRHLTRVAVFCNTPSLYKSGAASSSDKKLSSMLQYTLCVARFAHAIKRLGHHKVGQLRNADGIKGELRTFLSSFVLTNAEAPKRKRAEKPLRQYALEVTPTPGQSGYFDCEIMLQMHHELDAVKVELRTQLVGMESKLE